MSWVVNHLRSRLRVGAARVLPGSAHGLHLHSSFVAIFALAANKEPTHVPSLLACRKEILAVPFALASRAPQAFHWVLASTLGVLARLALAGLAIGATAAVAATAHTATAIAIAAVAVAAAAVAATPIASATHTAAVIAAASCATATNVTGRHARPASRL